MLDRRDYLMRQIEMAGRMLAAILDKLRTGQPIELGMFDQAYQPLLGVRARLVPVLPEEQLLDRLKPNGRPDHARWPVLVRLLLAEGDLYARQGARADAFARYDRALFLLRELDGDPADPAAPPPREPALAAEVADRLRGFRLGPARRVAVAGRYERAGRFGDAEDTFFEGLDDFEDAAGQVPTAPAPGLDPDPDPAAVAAVDDLVEQAIVFYRRLLTLDDATLDAGNLPRAEAEAALAELLGRKVGTGG